MATVLNIDGFIGEVLDVFTGDIKNTSSQGLNKNMEDVTGDIELHINSKGGDVFEGMAILSTLLNYKGGNKVAIVDGICASAATLPLFAMNTVKAHPTTMFCFHKSGTMAFGHATDLRKAADDLERIDSSVVELYMSKFKGSEEELHALLDEDRLMTAQEALELGFIDEIIAEKEEEEPELKVTMSLLDAFKLSTERIEMAKKDKKKNPFAKDEDEDEDTENKEDKGYEDKEDKHKEDKEDKPKEEDDKDKDKKKKSPNMGFFSNFS